ncbi:hypothetical protein RCO27_05405 [Sphingosinicella sp. LHD-64]|uniref:hypothetical protein n=1 Tax=Sphingosinicella sp. LHD-64 TaxID=3072139 RepID=UPI00280F30E7|nr:hypothetical protein [Sphingosinicella sp. LHD-64]MDQ8755659.1 hypothetical protein [Sphingosinicella sp. LHD-64]
MSDEKFAPDAPFTSSDFHNVTQKQILNAVHDTLAQAKMPWEAIRPFLETARDMCRADFAESASIRFHTVQADGDAWVDAEEAFLGISVADRDSGAEWLADTYWVSDIATIDDDPELARAVVRALERSIARINAWLAGKEAGGAAKATPPANKDA